MYWFLDPIQNHYADFSGRATRQEFWMFALFAFGIGILLNLLATQVSLFVLFHVAFLFGTFIPGCAIGARRLHDTGKSGWWQLVGIIPLVGLLLVIILMALEGEEGPNQYGPDPRAESMPEVQPTPTEAAPVSEIPPASPTDTAGTE